jgi:chromosome partitioning protein
LKIITLFNHKGGVGKTTLTYNIAWSLHEQGKKVLMIDADPQCNLTEFVCGVDEDKIETDNIYSYLRPYINPIPGEQLPTKNYLIEKKENLKLLAGSIRFAEYESDISLSMAGIPALRNIPTSFYDSIKKLGADVDYVLVDLSPSLSATNELMLMMSDYFITPVSPSIFSLQALNNLGDIFRRWNRDLSKFDFFNAKKLPQFTGVVFQNYRPYTRANEENTKSSQRFQERLVELNKVSIELAKNLNGFGMAISKDDFVDFFPAYDAYKIAQIPDHNQLGLCSESEKLPVCALDSQILNKYKINTPQYIVKLNDFKSECKKITEGIMRLP